MGSESDADLARFRDGPRAEEDDEEAEEAAEIEETEEEEDEDEENKDKAEDQDWEEEAAQLSAPPCLL